MRMQSCGSDIAIDVGGSIRRVEDRFETVDLAETNRFSEILVFSDDFGQADRQECTDSVLVMQLAAVRTCLSVIRAPEHNH